MTPSGPRLVPDSPAPAPIAPGRGKFLNAEQIIQRWFRPAEGEDPLVKPRWVRDNFPGKVVLSETRVGWYEQDVEFVVNEARRTGTPIKEVQLPRPAA